MLRSRRPWPTRRRAMPGISHVVNGRFKGGYITRHYGDPAQHVHAVQLEMCQSLYMSEQPPYEYRRSAGQPSPAGTCGNDGRRAGGLPRLCMDTEQQRFLAPAAWVNGSWAQDVLLTVGADGLWSEVAPNASAEAQRRRAAAGRSRAARPGRCAQPRLPARHRRPDRTQRAPATTTSGAGATACTARRTASRRSNWRRSRPFCIRNCCRPATRMSASFTTCTTTSTAARMRSRWRCRWRWCGRRSARVSA